MTETWHTLSHIVIPNIISNNEPIEIVTTFKCLGILIDSKLTFTDHVSYIHQKAISGLKMLGKLRPIVDENTALTLCKSLVAPFLTMGM